MLTDTRCDAGGLALNLAVGPVTGPPLLLMHGITRRWQDYAALVPGLAQRWHVLGLDFRGHGLSARAPSYLVVDYVRDVVAVIRQQTRERVVLFGHSLGALVAAGVAAELPDQVRAIVLEDPPFESVGAGIKKTLFHAMFVAIAELTGPDRSVVEIAAGLSEIGISLPGMTVRLRLGDLRDAAGIRFMASCLRLVDPAVLTPLIAGQLLDGYDSQKVLRGIQCPTLLLQGEAALGGMLDDDAAARTIPHVADCTHVRVAGAGHLIHSMQHETTLRLVTDFLESLRTD